MVEVELVPVAPVALAIGLVFPHGDLTSLQLPGHLPLVVDSVTWYYLVRVGSPTDCPACFRQHLRSPDRRSRRQPAGKYCIEEPGLVAALWGQEVAMQETDDPFRGNKLVEHGRYECRLLSHRLCRNCRLGGELEERRNVR